MVYYAPNTFKFSSSAEVSTSMAGQEASPIVYFVYHTAVMGAVKTAKPPCVKIGIFTRLLQGVRHTHFMLHTVHVSYP